MRNKLGNGRIIVAASVSFLVITVISGGYYWEQLHDFAGLFG